MRISVSRQDRIRLLLFRSVKESNDRLGSLFRSSLFDAEKNYRRNRLEKHFVTLGTENFSVTCKPLSEIELLWSMKEKKWDFTRCPFDKNVYRFFFSSLKRCFIGIMQKKAQREVLRYFEESRELACQIEDGVGSRWEEKLVAVGQMKKAISLARHVRGVNQTRWQSEENDRRRLSFPGHLADWNSVLYNLRVREREREIFPLSLRKNTLASKPSGCIFAKIKQNAIRKKESLFFLSFFHWSD